MNRRTLLQGIATGVAASLAGCETVLFGKERNEIVVTARSELADATAILNGIELTSDGEVTVNSRDFEGYSVEDVTTHTDLANQTLAKDDSGASEVLSAVSTILEETAYQYTAIDDVFGYATGYERLYANGEYDNAVDAAHRLAESLSEVASQSRTITDELVRLDNADYGNPVEGFSVDNWADEQSIFVGMIQRLNPLGVGFTRQANGMRLLASASVRRDQEEYQTGIKELQDARSSFERANEQLSVSLNRELTHFRPFVKQLTCLSEGYINPTTTAIDALEAYDAGDRRRGDNLWEQAITEMEETNSGCLSGTKKE